MKHRLIILGCIVTLFYSCNPQKEQTANSTVEKTIPKSVKLEGQSNFRDLGGYKTTDGKSIKHGMLFRSGTLSNLTDTDVRKLQDFGSAVSIFA